MKLLVTFAVLAFVFLTGCSSDEKAAEPADTAIDQPQAVDTEMATTAPETAPQGDERPQAVEESGGEPDAAEAEEKPILLAQATTATPSRSWEYKDGIHFKRLVPTQPTLGGADKIEVAEVFWYGCGHCYEFEAHLNSWADTLPVNARFVRIPATWNPLVKLHAQLYYTGEVLGKNGKIEDPAAFHASVFAEYHRRGNRLTSLTAIREIFGRAGVSDEDFDSTWGSFEVAQKLRVAQDLSRRYAITGVPAMVVNGKFKSGKTETGTYPILLKVVDELIERETAR